MTDTQTKDAPEQLGDLPSTETLEECPNIAQAAADMLSWISCDTVWEAIGKRVPVERDQLRHVKHFLLLLDTFPFRIRTSRPDEDLTEPKDRLVLEDGASQELVADRGDDGLRSMERCGLLAYDDAGILHVTDKGRALIGPVVGKPGCGKQEPPASTKPYICCTMNREELQRAATDWLYYWIESAGSDDCIALKHHAESLAVEGANAGYAATFQAVMLHSLIEASLDGMITLVAPLIEKYVIPNVDWRKAAIEATERYDAHEKEIQARVWADRQSAKAEPSSSD